jgi:hypothetical protein
VRRGAAPWRPGSEGRTSPAAGAATLEFVTIAENSANYGSNVSKDGTGSLSLHNVILASAMTPSSCWLVNVATPITSQGFNISDAFDSACGLTQGVRPSPRRSRALGGRRSGRADRDHGPRVGQPGGQRRSLCGKHRVRPTRCCTPPRGPPATSAPSSTRRATTAPPPPPTTMSSTTIPAPTSVITASDALVVLRAAVGAMGCELCVCDVDGSGRCITATDALARLRAAVGLDVVLSCPACPS